MWNISHIPQLTSNDYNLPSSLDAIRELAEDFAHIEYERGPGQNAKMARTADIEENKRRKKKKSAYITRFRQKHYESLLERRVAVSEMEMRTGADVRRDLIGSNGQLKEQLRMLERMLAENGNGNGDGGEEVKTSAEVVAANVVATEEAQDLVNGSGFGGGAFVENSGDANGDGGTYMQDWTGEGDVNVQQGAGCDVETESSEATTSLSSMHSGCNDFGDSELYSKPSFDDYMMKETNPQFIDPDVSNLLATLAKAA